MNQKDLAPSEVLNVIKALMAYPPDTIHLDTIQLFRTAIEALKILNAHSGVGQSIQNAQSAEDARILVPTTDGLLRQRLYYLLSQHLPGNTQTEDLLKKNIKLRSNYLNDLNILTLNSIS